MKIFTMRPADDAELDRFSFTPKPDQEYLERALDHSSYEDVVTSTVPGTLLSAGWSSVRYIAGATADRTLTRWNDCGFRYPIEDALEDDEQPFKGVHVYSPAGDCVAGTHAFERMVTRFLRAAMSAAATSPHPQAHQDWWRDIPAAIERIEKRLSEESTPV